MELAYVDQGYTGDVAAQAAAQHGIQLEVVKLPQAKKGFVLLPRRWVVERSFGWLDMNRRLSKDYEGVPETTEAWIYLSMSRLLLRRLTGPTNPGAKNKQLDPSRAPSQSISRQ